MTQAQKTAKDKFKKAIAYRKKTGVSLKEAFAHIYGKKIGAVKKKTAPKKKAAKKVIRKKLTRLDYDKRYQAKKPGKRTSASGNTYYESRPNRSDRGKLLGIGSIKYMSNKYINTINEINNYESIIKNIQNNMNIMSLMEKKRAKETITNFKKIVKELKTHARELKKLI